MPIAMFPVVKALVVLFVVSASLVFTSFFLTLGVGLNRNRRSKGSAQDKWAETTVYAVHPAVLLGSRFPSSNLGQLRVYTLQPRFEVLPISFLWSSISRERSAARGDSLGRSRSEASKGSLAKANQSLSFRAA
jgi:hypothetical protein